ncbi:MAG: efflux RND transporter periplasmic adaptor subunit [Proteobacteria bacterium]|nr:efflux RND transporter periplasmic adaptor subunit [Pseudomonadota bacterium]
MRRKLDYFSTLSALFLTLILLTGCDRSEGKIETKNNQPQVRRTKVSVITVVPTPVRDVLVLPGETEAWQDVRLASETDGIVEVIDPREGDRVREGQLIAQIDVSTLKAALDQAEASFDLADKVYERRKLLFERKVIAKEELDRSENERTLALTNLRRAKVMYERGFLRSPINGLVNYLHVDVGEFVDRGDPVADLVNLDKIKINVNVPELDVRYLRVGQQALLTVDAFPERQLTGIVDFVAYKADPATKTFHVRVLIENPKHEIRPGMISRVTFLRRVIPDALVVPLFALVDKGGERIVFVEKDGIAYARTVAIGVIEGDRIQITKGLEVGDHVIVNGQTELEEGMQVQVQ